jgi:UDP-N-acetyl-2-amino-2-deoxyglucuronate dehydrogenase
MPQPDPYAGRPIRFGLVGCGTIGPTHAAALGQLPGAELVAVTDVLPDRAADLAGRFGVRTVHPDLPSLLADPAVDVVCLCTPSGLHADAAVAALDAGKHVVIEKPMDVTVEQCDRVLAAQARAGRLVAVISQHRFDPATERVKQLADAGRLGRLVLVTGDVKWYRAQTYYDAGEWRGTWALDGGGALMNQGVHTVDLLLHLAGPVRTVYAQARTAAHERIEVEDVVVATLTFATGAIGTLVATTAAFDGLPVRVDLFGTGGSAVLEGDALKLLRVRDDPSLSAAEPAAAHAISVAAGGTAAASAVDSAAAATWGDAHRAQLADVVACLRTGGRPRSDGVAGRAAVEVVRAVYASARLGRAIEVGLGPAV